MNTTATAQSSYALGHSAQELARLSRQGQAFRPFTRQLFEEAGIQAGMHILDVGSGAGDVAFLAAEMAGPGGEVVGVDCVPAAVEYATARARSRGIRNVKFLTGDPTLMEFHAQFDAIVGRIVLMYYRSPLDAIQQLLRHLRPDGLIVFQEFDMDYASSRPHAPTFELAAHWMKRTFRATGTSVQLGAELYPLFLQAGLPAPSLRLDVLIGGGPEFQAYELMAGVIQSLLPVMERIGIVTAADVNVQTLATRMREEVVTAKGIVLSPALIGAWSRKPTSR
jgi:ubiquinone/menaquinone biosynthesis C-methylase UbiE